MNLAVSSLHQSGLVHSYWEDAVRLAVLCLNRIGEPTKSNVEKGFPESFSRLERLHGVPIPTRLNGIYPLGVLAYARVPQELRRKFEPRAVPCIYLGLHATIKGARLLEMDTNRFTVSAVFTISEGHFPLMVSTVATASKEFLNEHSIRDVTESPATIWPSSPSFNDVLALNGPRVSRSQPIVSSARPTRQWAPSAQALQNIASTADAVDRRAHAGNANQPEGESSSHSVLLVSDQDVSPFCFLNPVTPWISESDDYLPDQLLPSEQVLAVDASPLPTGLPLDRHEYLALTPTTHARTLTSPHALYWASSEQKEVAAHIKNETFGPLLECPPQNFGLLPLNAVYRNKFTGDGKVAPQDLAPDSWKTRMVILGYLMVSGRDYEETFAPTASPTSIRMLAVLATRLRFVVKVADVETAFLVPKMDKVVFVKALLWYEQIIAAMNKTPIPTALPPRACRQLLKGVPGIKQGSRLFYQDIKKALLNLGFTVHPVDPCVFFRLPSKSFPFAALAVWVDDIFAVMQNDDEWSSLLTGLRKTFSVADKGDVKMFLGMEIAQTPDRSTVTFSQRISIDNLLSRAASSMKSSHPCLTPCVAGFIFTKADCPFPANARPFRMPEFRGLIALANYISVWTRADITYVVNKLCKYMPNPGDRHIDMFERLLRYLIGTRNLGLVYSFNESASPIVAYSDSSHMDCVDSSRSTLAYLFFFFGQVVSWYSKLHSFVTTCSNHSEYAALFQAAKEAQYLLNWLSPLAQFLNIVVTPIPVFNDNDCASALANDPVGRFKNKHVKMEHHYTQELVAAKVIAPVRVSTNENKSDLLTKALGPTVFPPMAQSLVGNTVDLLPARVLMLRVVPDSPSVEVPFFRVRDFAVIRMRDVGTQCDFVTVTRDASTQYDSDAKDVGCQCDFGGGEDPNSPSRPYADVQAAWQEVVLFGQNLCACAENLTIQQQSLLDEIAAHDARVEAYRSVPSVSLLPSVAVPQVAHTRPIGPRPVLHLDNPGGLRAGGVAPWIRHGSSEGVVARSPRKSIANSRARHHGVSSSSPL